MLYLIRERIILNRWLNSIPLRITVTGTRGKSSVTRIIASILREHGKKVLAKTTGSEAKWILPDGTENEIKRRGIPSIIEQKKLLKQANRMKVDCIVSEIMSIHPENHFAESQQILKPHIVVMTNVRLDHTDAMGNSLEQIASVFSQDVPEKAIVFIPENENFAIFSSTVERKSGQLFRVAPEMSHRLKAYNFSSIKNEFGENIDLAYAVAKYLDIDDRVIANGIEKASHDMGHFKIWKFSVENKKKNFYFVNGFAANDPQSTVNLIAKIKEDMSFSSQRIYGILNLRSDRAERTLQWIQFLQSDAGNIFSQLFICGPHAPIVRRKLKIGLVMKHHSPEKILEIISEIADDQSVIFGFGNIAGMGRKIIDDLNRIGVEYGV